MRQSWDEYVEGRLAIGSCGLTVLIVGIVIAVIIISVNRFINDFNIWKLLVALLWVIPIILLIIAVIISYKKENKK